MHSSGDFVALKIKIYLLYSVFSLQEQLRAAGKQLARRMRILAAAFALRQLCAARLGEMSKRRDEDVCSNRKRSECGHRLLADFGAHDNALL